MKGRAQHRGEGDQLLNLKTPVVGDISKCQLIGIEGRSREQESRTVVRCVCSRLRNKGSWTRTKKSCKRPGYSAEVFVVSVTYFSGVFDSDFATLVLHVSGSHSQELC